MEILSAPVKTSLIGLNNKSQHTVQLFDSWDFTATVAVKKQVLQKDQTCQYKDKSTGRICGTRWTPHTDHAKPKWAGGGNKKENLQILCQKHNHYKYRKEVGIEFIN